MRNPLYKRLKREFVSDLGKYIVIIIFFIALCGLISGYIVGNDSMIKTYYDNLESNKVEDGHFETTSPLNDSQITSAQNSYDLTIYNSYFKEEDHQGHVVRTFAIEDRIGIVNDCEIMKGTLPTKENEIALDRSYCDSNNLNVGDEYTTNSGTFIITAQVALVDYSSLFQNNSDALMNTKSFCVALVTKDTFNNVLTSSLHYNYAYRFNGELTDAQKDEQSEKLMTYLYVVTLKGLENFVPVSQNQAIYYSIDDVEHDLVFLEIFFYLIVVGLAFVFAITTKTKIEQEAKTIGTLKAMGYSRMNILGHYLILPALATFVGAALGNVLGYTYFADFTTSLYYRSYSLPPYTLTFSAKAFLLVTLVPIALVLLISFIILFKKLGVPTKTFLQGRVKKRKKPTAFELPKKMSYMNKVHFRVLSTAKSVYVSLAIGLLFANLIAMFGLCLNPMLTNFKKQIMDSQVAPYVYVLKSDYEVSDPSAEKIKVASLNVGSDSVQIIGVSKWGEDSNYLTDINLVSGECVISRDMYEKYRLKTGSTFTAKEEYSSNEYTLKVSSLKDQSGAFYVYMDMATFDTILKDVQSLNGYLSQNELEIPEDKIYTVITINDLNATADQMTISMSDVFVMFDIFAIILFFVIIYLLARIVIEKNSQSIAMMKILGFNNLEINRAYNLTTGIAVLVFDIITIPLAYLLLRFLWIWIMTQRMKGWITFYIAPWIYFALVAMAIGAFLIVFLIEYFKTKKIPLSLALKRE